MEKLKALNNIPKHWKLVKVGEYVISVKGKKPKLVSPVKTKECYIPYVNIKAFEKNIIDEFTDGVGCVLCDKGDFLMVWDGSRSGYVGKAIKGALGSTLVKLNFPNIDNNYAYYFLQSKFIEINTRAKGVGIPHVDPNILRNYYFPIPPLPEQQAIVSKIEELLSDLDNGKQQLQTAQQQLKVYRQSLLKWAFDNITTPLIKTVEESCTHIVDCLHSTAKFSLQGKYCVDTTCIENGRIVFENIRFVDDKTYNERISRLKPEYGDILFSREGTVGTTLIVPKNIELCLGQRMMMFRFKKEILPKYILYYFQSSKFKSQYQPLIMGTTAPHLNIRDIRKFNITLCSLSEQQQIVDELESKLTVCDKIEETISQSLLQAETLRQSILKKAFEGRLV